MKTLYDGASLASLVNSGRFTLPLSNTRSLHLIAILEGAENWFEVTRLPGEDIEMLRLRARKLRQSVNGSLVDQQLSAEPTPNA